MSNEMDIQIWAGIECTINRIGNNYLDQLAYAGHYNRSEEDIALIATLGVKMLRYPILWEKHQPENNTKIDWCFAKKNLYKLKEYGIDPIIGLVHHGSGPKYVNFFDGSFHNNLARYARKVAEQFPWAEYYTPVNEPLTTARFCGLYGHWYPHLKDDYCFYKILLSECKGIVLAMQEIRKVNPNAKLIQTEDLGKSFSTPLLAYQANFENHRRWLSYDLLLGRVSSNHFMWNAMTSCGIKEEEILFFSDNKCMPDIAGFNYYITSERYLDENLAHYSPQYHGGNGIHQYVDIETVKAALPTEGGPAILLKEAWEHLRIPLAITECHLHSPREDQMRWFNVMWNTVNKIKNEGVDLRAITAWAMFGLYGWNCLLTKPCGDYESGIFNVSTGHPRPTALTKFIQELTKNKKYHHPILDQEGWWERIHNRKLIKTKAVQANKQNIKCRPLLILGKTGTLGSAFSRICKERNIHHLLLGRNDCDITNREIIKNVIQKHHPWAIINAAGYVRVDDAEQDEQSCMYANCNGPATLARMAEENDIKFLSFSSDLVFDGMKKKAYTESDETCPLNVYGRSKVLAEKMIFESNPNALIIRTSSFFGPWDIYNFVYQTINDLKQGRMVQAANDIYISPTYVPDLVHTSLELLIDNERGIFHVTNSGSTTWFELAKKTAILADCDISLINQLPTGKMLFKAKRPAYSVLISEKGILLPHFENALERYLECSIHVPQNAWIA